MSKFEVYEDAAGWAFVLKAGNGEPLARGRGFANRAAVKNAIDAVRREAADAAVEVIE